MTTTVLPAGFSGNSLNAVMAPSHPSAAPAAKTREAFQNFVAGTFYQMMLKSLRSGQEKPAYFHGGQAEEVFQNQLDQHVAEDLAQTHGAQFSDTLFQQFSYQMR